MNSRLVTHLSANCEHARVTSHALNDQIANLQGFLGTAKKRRRSAIISGVGEKLRLAMQFSLRPKALAKDLV